MIAGLTARRYCSRWRVPFSSLAIALRSDSKASRSLTRWRRAEISSTNCFLVFLSSSDEAADGATPGAGTSCFGLPVRLSASYIDQSFLRGGIADRRTYRSLRVDPLGRPDAGFIQLNQYEYPFICLTVSAIAHVRVRQLSL